MTRYDNPVPHKPIYKDKMPLCINPKVDHWHIPTSTDLAKGQKVATKDVSGEFTETGIIDRIYEDWGVLIYEIDFTAYVANELRLLKN